MTFLARLVRRCSSLLTLAVAVATIVPDLASARVIEQRHYRQWTYRFFEANSGWRSCDVRTTWPNNDQVLMIRLMRDRIEHYFYNRNWNLITRRRMRETEFDFGSRRFFATSQTLSSPKAIYGRINVDLTSFVRYFRGASRMRVYYPNGDSFNVGLRGSSSAMRAALECWNRYLRYR